MKPEQRNPVVDEPAFLRLGEIEHEIFTRRTHRGKPVFKDPVVFSEKLHALALEYAKKIEAVQGKESRQRYRAVAKAADRLQDALLALREGELESLGWRQQECLSKHLKELADDRDSSDSPAPDFSDETLYPRRAGQILWSGDLIWLRAGAERLSKSDKQGRPSNSTEFWAATEFVELCHGQGWPLTVANSGSERRNGHHPVESDSIRCLAAVFAQAGKHPVESIRHAKTMLKKFHQPQTHEKWDNSEYDDLGPTRITLGLKKRRIHPDAGIEELKKFIPPGH